MDIVKRKLKLRVLEREKEIISVRIKSWAIQKNCLVAHGATDETIYIYPLFQFSFEVHVYDIPEV